MTKSANKLNNVYLKIDGSNYFEETNDKEDKDIICEKERIFNEIKDSNNPKLEVLKEIITKYTDKFFPDEKDKSIFSMSIVLSKHFCKSKNLKKSSMENYINYFFNKRSTILYSNSFTINIEIIINMGNIISYIYSRFESFKIKTKPDILDNIKKSGEQIRNILTYFYNYCSDNNLAPNEENKCLFWHENRKNYNLPGELLFLLNIFTKINVFNFDLNFLDEAFNEEIYKYLFLVLMNIDLFLLNLKSIKFNLIHEKLQKNLYPLYNNEILYDIYPETLKINRLKDNESIYTRKWNFEKNFMLEEIRNLEIIEKEKIKKKNEDKNFGDFTIIQNRKSAFNTSFLRKTDTIENKNFEEIYNISNQSFCDNTNIPFIETNIRRLKSFYTHDYNDKLNKKAKKEKIKEKTKAIIKEEKSLIEKKNENENMIKKEIEFYHYSFEVIISFFILVRYYKLESIDLVMNDAYSPEIIYYFKKFLKLDILNEDNYNYRDFHIIDLVINILRTMRTLNIEIDSLDINTFDKLLNILFINNRIKELKFSFFTSDINYISFRLTRTYFRFIEKTECIKNSENNENYILEYICPYFKNNLLFLMNLIKIKKLNKLGLNFDIPSLIQNKDDYMMIILKFILNIFIHLNESECKINELVILSPKTIFDGKLMANIDKIFEELNFYENNMYLYELHIQFTIYKVPNIKNVISKNLLCLSIGDLDIPTFESIVNYLNSYKFAISSLLRKIKIKLLNNIENLSPKLKVILPALFNVKLKNLKKLNLYTNIILINQKEYSFFVKILKDNWISSYTLIFNKLSQEYFNKYSKSNKITYLVPHNLENEIIGPDKANNKNISTNPDDSAYWILKYLFNNRHFYISNNFRAKKYYIYNILKYLYFVKKTEIIYDIKTSEEDNKK